MELTTQLITLLTALVVMKTAAIQFRSEKIKAQIEATQSAQMPALKKRRRTIAFWSALFDLVMCFVAPWGIWLMSRGGGPVTMERVGLVVALAAVWVISAVRPKS